MTFPDWIAAVVLFLNLPIPLYWYIVHPLVAFWRHHEKAAYVTGLLCSWPLVTAGMIVYSRVLFRPDWPPAWAFVAGVALIGLEGWIFWRVRHDLGGARLVGRTELSGGGEIASQGIYSRLRHPRYAGSLLAILGSSLLGGTRAMWIVAGAWAVLMRLAIVFEERELHVRFGAAYEAYCRRVPRFLPLRAGSREA